MERKVIEEFSKTSPLSLRFLQCFDENFTLEASKLAVMLSQLGIEFDHSTPFDQNISLAVLKQFESLLCHLGDTSHREELIKLQKDKKLIDKLIEILEELRLKKKDLDLSEEQFNAKRSQIEKLYHDKKELERSTNGNVICLTTNDILEKNSFVSEKTKNQQLKTEIEALEDELQGMMEFDLTSEDKLDEQISYLERKYCNFYQQEEENKFFNSSK